MGDELNLRELMAVLRERDPKEFDKIAAELQRETGTGRGRPSWVSKNVYQAVWVSFEVRKHFSRVKTDGAIARKLAGDPNDPDSGIIAIKPVINTKDGKPDLETHQWNNPATLERLYREAKTYLKEHGDDLIDHHQIAADLGEDLNDYPPDAIAKLPKTVADEWREALECQITGHPPNTSGQNE